MLNEQEIHYCHILYLPFFLYGAIFETPSRSFREFHNRFLDICCQSGGFIKIVTTLKSTNGLSLKKAQLVVFSCLFVRSVLLVST